MGKQKFILTETLRAMNLSSSATLNDLCVGGAGGLNDKLQDQA